MYHMYCQGLRAKGGGSVYSSNGLYLYVITKPSSKPEFT